MLLFVDAAEAEASVNTLPPLLLLVMRTMAFTAMMRSSSSLLAPRGCGGASCGFWNGTTAAGRGSGTAGGAMRP